MTQVISASFFYANAIETRLAVELVKSFEWANLSPERHKCLDRVRVQF